MVEDEFTQIERISVQIGFLKVKQSIKDMHKHVKYS